MNTPCKHLSISRRTAVGALLGVAATRLDAQADRAAPARRTLIVPNSIGSSSDTTARKLVELSELHFGEISLVQNTPGAGGIIAVNSFLRGPRDGSTVLVSNSGLICNTPVLSPDQVKYNPELDLVPICTLATVDSVVVVGSKFPATNLKEFQEAGAKETVPVLYAIGSTGNSHHIGGELLFKLLGLAAVAVPYRDNTKAVIDVSEGRVPLGIFSLPNVSSFLNNGKLKAISILSDRRLEAAPTIQTAQEQGFPGFDIKGWIALFYANGVPSRVINDYEMQLSKIFHQHKLSKFIGDIGLNPMFLGQAKSQLFVQAEIKKYRKILTEINLKVS